MTQSHIVAAAYCRTSTDMQDHSLEDQQAVISRRASQDGLEISFIYEEVISGTSLNRPQLQRMLADAEAGKFQRLYFHDLSRLARNQGHQMGLIEQLVFRNVEAIGVADGFDTRSENYRIVAGAWGLVHDMFVTSLKTNIRRGAKQRVLRGLPAGGLPYGFSLDVEAGGKYKINPDEAANVASMFESANEDRTPRWIAHSLNEKRRFNRRGNAWSHSAIIGILTNPIYRGVYTYNTTEMIKHPKTGRRLWKPRPESEWITLPMEHCRIVSDDIWYAVQERRSHRAKPMNLAKRGANRRRREKTPRQPRRRKGDYGQPKTILSGLLQCGFCQGAYVIKDTNSYRCGTHHSKGASVCPNNVRVKIDVAQREILAAIRQRLFGSNKDIEQFKRDLRWELITAGDRASPELLGLRKRERQNTKDIAAIIEGVKSAGWSDALGVELRKLEDDQKAIRRQIEATESAAQVANALPHLLDKRDNVLADLEDLSKRDMFLAQRHLRNILGGPVVIYPTPERNVIAAIRGSFIGLLEAIDQHARARFLLSKAVGRYDAAKQTEYGTLIRRLRDLFDDDSEEEVLRDATLILRSTGALNPAELVLVAEEGFEPPTQGL